MNERLLWLWLSLKIPAGSRVGSKLLWHFENNVDNIYRATRGDYAKCGFLNAQLVTALSDKSLAEAESIVAWCEKYKVFVLTMPEGSYPKTLRDLKNPPLVLYGLGAMPDFDADVFIAVVGTRSMSEYGRITAYDMGRGLAAGGACVVSGMARGVDSTAQIGALDAGGKTVAVLGCGINVVYPKENRPLMRRIVRDGGVILTEYPPNTPPHGVNFPIRNRIISGLCQGTVVVEADQKSGALITARETVMQGRDLYAVPGEIRTTGSSGTNALIKEGARVAITACDVLENYAFMYPHCINMSAAKQCLGEKYGYYFHKKRREEAKRQAPDINLPEENSDTEEKKQATTNKPVPKKEKAQKKPDLVGIPEELEDDSVTEIIPAFDVSILNEEELRVYQFMTVNKPVSADELIACGLKSNRVSVALTMLELYGAVEAHPGGFYIRKQ